VKWAYRTLGVQGLHGSVGDQDRLWGGVKKPEKRNLFGKWQKEAMVGNEESENTRATIECLQGGGKGVG